MNNQYEHIGGGPEPLEPSPLKKLLDELVVRINEQDKALDFMDTQNLLLNERVAKLEAKYDQLADRHVTLVARHEVQEQIVERQRCILKRLEDARQQDLDDLDLAA